MRRGLEAAADATGRSLSQEAELRLEQSLTNQRELFGGEELYRLFRLLGAAAGVVEQRTGSSWSTDYKTFLAVKAAWDALIKAAQPKPDQKLIEETRALHASFPGEPPTPPQPPSAPGESRLGPRS